MAKYQTNFEIDTTDGSEMIEIRNPSGSGKNLEILKISVVAETGFDVYDFQRFDALATHAVAPDPEPTPIFENNISHPFCAHRNSPR
jgi:hypothetical protein